VSAVEASSIETELKREATGDSAARRISQYRKMSARALAKLTTGVSIMSWFSFFPLSALPFQQPVYVRSRGKQRTKYIIALKVNEPRLILLCGDT
jgi:hypothetical protein